MKNYNREFDSAQLERLKTIPPARQNLFRQAYTGRSRKAAIKAFCIECMGFSYESAKDCRTTTCPLYAVHRREFNEK